MDNCTLIHPSIKFTMSHTTPSVVDNEIVVDLYKKPTDRCQYLLTSSCHPPHITENIPFSLAYRIVRICTDQTTRDRRLQELKDLLVSRDYKAKLVDASIKKAIQIPREQALKKVEKAQDPNKKRPVFSVEYHPALPSLSKILQKHWRVMVEDPNLKEAFPLPPMVAYRRPPNLKEKLIRAKVPPSHNRPQRKTPGMKKCKFSCLTCPYVQTGRTITATASNFKHDIQGSVDCHTQNVVYCLSCDKCQEQYVGETEKSLNQRFSQHRGYVNTKKLDQATGHHFNLPGHSLSDMRISVIEKVYSKDPQMRKTRESFFINKLNTYHKGMNRRK